MDLTYFYTFKEVAKSGSYTKTGEELGYAQSSVTTQIKKLEEHYHTVLFERVGRRMCLTQSGEQLLHYVNQIVSLVEEAEIQLTKGTNLRGTLKVGTVESLAAYFLTPYIKSLKEPNPDMKILLESGLCQHLRDGVIEGKFDAALLLDQLQESPELMTIPIREEELVMVSSPNHPLRNRTEVMLKDLSEETIIFTEEGCSYRIMFENALRTEGVQTKSKISFSSLEAIKQCVADDLGIAILPKIAVQRELKANVIRQLPFQHESIKVFTQLVYHKKKWISPIMAQLIELLNTNGTSEQKVVTK
ncbi:LysR family transcriptional regulator [Falsibacillus albus]|uniref:LysR family transcriptional regulator n=1 Tax=Falsibacillus albus TaxID=2478915 RepID=A0A3L7JU89_9BACI|nr:LysR family transcriptional regulator [Falsibacillus albus]RLQ94080.1 LysR family transcriptional regulator [Falsibacillus albus]